MHDYLANQRTELAYSPFIVNLIKTRGEYSKYSTSKPDGEATRMRADEIVAMWKNSGAKDQPFLTRTSGSKPERPVV